jgi:hypothetical protein
VPHLHGICEGWNALHFFPLSNSRILAAHRNHIPFARPEERRTPRYPRKLSALSLRNDSGRSPDTACAEFLAQAFYRWSLVTHRSPPIREFSTDLRSYTAVQPPETVLPFPVLNDDADVTIGGQTHSAGRKTPHARTLAPCRRGTSPVAQACPPWRALLFTQRRLSADEEPVRLRQARHSADRTTRDLTTISISLLVILVQSQASSFEPPKPNRECAINFQPKP